MDAHDPALLGRVRQALLGADPDLPHGSIALLDQGLRPFARPGVIVDHHAPEGDDPAAMPRAALPDPEDGHVGNGHPRATGGSLSPREFERLLEGLARTSRAATAAAA